MATRAAVVMLLIAALSDAGPRQDLVTSLSVMDALELYELGDPEIIKLVATPRQIGSIETELIKGAPAWIKAHGATEAPRRRLVAATFALEAARHGLHGEDIGHTYNLIEWASNELRTDRTPLPGERLWRIGAVSLLAGWLAYFQVEMAVKTTGRTLLNLFEDHLSVAERRFPGEPRWTMARGYVAELYAIQSHLRQPPFDLTVTIPNDVVQLYEKALAAPEVEAEAHLRLSYLQLMGGDTDRAIAHAERATLTRETDIKYLAELFRGWALTRQGHNDEALSAFRLAHDALPNGQNGALWLANRLFLDGHREEAVAIVDDSLETAVDADPWTTYFGGPFRAWPSLIKELRAALR